MTRFQKVSRVTRLGYQGQVNVIENGHYLWAKSTGVNRLTKTDAMIDAEILAKNIAEQNGLVG